MNLDREDLRITSTIWRRHSANCGERSNGRYSMSCGCPLWGDGCVEAVRVFRKSLNTRSIVVARKRLARVADRYFESIGLETNESAKMSRTPETLVSQHAPIAVAVPLPEKKAETKNLADPAMIATAAKAYLANCVTNGVKPPTIGKYRNTLNQLKTFAETDEICRAKKVCRVADLNVTDLDRFRAGRKIAPITSSKELECLKSFFEFCTSREFCPKNVAASIKGPKIVDQNDVVPYTTDEMNAIIDASGRFGQNDYERRRGRAMVLILRHTALRISDVALMRRDRITHTATGWRIFVRTTKNHELVYLLVPDELVNAVNSLPVPRGASKDCPYLFWNNNSKPKSQISEVSETVAAIYKKSGVQDASSHRWRHSIATELLGIGATFEEVADVLGNSPAIVRKHYAKWSQQRQNRIDDLIQKVREEAWRR